MGPRHPYFNKTCPCNFDELSELRTRASELLSSAFRTSKSLSRCSAVVRYVVFLPPDPICYIWPSTKLPNSLPKIIPLLKLALSTEQIKFKVFNIMLKIPAIVNDWQLVYFPCLHSQQQLHPTEWGVYKSGVDGDLVGRVIEGTVRGHLKLILTQSVIPQITKGSGLRWTLFSLETKSWWCIFDLATELGLSVMNRAEKKAENRDTGCLRIHTP